MWPRTLGGDTVPGARLPGLPRLGIPRTLAACKTLAGAKAGAGRIELAEQAAFGHEEARALGVWSYVG